MRRFCAKNNPSFQGSRLARINIEDSLWADDRFLALVEKISNRAAAVGAVVLAFRMAQKFWIPDRRPVPSASFRLLPFASELVLCGLASQDVTGESVTIKGSEEQFAWLLQKSKAGRAGGKASGITRRENKDKFSKRDEAGRSGAQRCEASSSSSSSSSKNKERPSGGVPALPEPPGAGSKAVGLGRSNPAARALSQSPLVIAAYVESYQKRYPGARPEITGKVQGQIRTLLKEMPVQRAVNMIQVYCQMDDPWFEKKHHDFGTFIENLNKVRFALETGRDGAGINWAGVWKEVDKREGKTIHESR